MPAMAAPPAPARAPAIPAVLTTALEAYRGGHFSEARRRFRALADADSAIAETMLGTMYARGEGVRADSATASAYYFRAAQRGYAPAQLALAQAFEAGSGVRLDHNLAWIWARRAQQRGDPRVAAAAAQLLAALGARRSAADRAGLEAQVAAWRPWPNGRD